MPNTKISALTAATTPLAGTEVLPIVQSGFTKQVSVSNLTAGRQISASGMATTGDVFIGASSPAFAERLRVSGNYMVLENGTYTGFIGAGNNIGVGGTTDFSFRSQAGMAFGVGGTTLALQFSSTANVTFNTGNLVQGTAAKGINFTANTPAAGMTSQLLNWYEEGTFTPTIVGTGSSGVGTYSSQVGRYTRIGRQVTVQIELAWSAHTGTGNMFVAGLPFACSTVRSSISAISYDMALAANCYLGGRVTASDTTIELLNLAVGGGAWSGVAMDTSVVALVVTAIYTV